MCFKQRCSFYYLQLRLATSGRRVDSSAHDELNCLAARGDGKNAVELHVNGHVYRGARGGAAATRRLDYDRSARARRDTNIRVPKVLPYASTGTRGVSDDAVRREDERRRDELGS